MSDPLDDLKASFFVECEELLESLLDALGRIAADDHDAETINVAFRAVHSIKGGAGAFALDDLVAFAHRFETVLDALRGGGLACDPGLAALLLRASDGLSDLVRSARDGTPLDGGAVDAVLADLTGLANDDPLDEALDFKPLALDIDDSPGLPDLHAPPLPPLDTLPDLSHFTIRLAPTPELYEHGNEPLFLLRALENLGRCRTTAQFEAPESVDAPPGALSWTVSLETAAAEPAVRGVFEFVEGLCALDIEKSDGAGPSASEPNTAGPTRRPAAAPVVAAPKPQSPSAQTVRVGLERVDRLVNQVGELVINQSMLAQSVAEADLPANSPVNEGLEELLRLTRDIQDSVMMIRAQPVKPLFQRMSRIVREASAAVGKTVELTTHGEATEIDKTVIERLADPLTHMIRNAVDHGIEDAEGRTAAGKPATGRIRLSAAHKSGRILIEIADDGGGIDRERVHATAVRKGLIAAEAQLSDADIDQLLFLPGFSTAAEVSNLSGRGVGMDVVKNAIAALGGRVSYDSRPGRGTTFSISLPLTLAVLDGMVVGVAGETLVVPLGSVLETMMLAAADIDRLGANAWVVAVRGDVVPLLDLGAELGYRERKTDYAGAIALLIGQEDGERAALVVDAIDDQRQVVIKGIEQSYGRIPGIAAATILGNGRIALILDTADLMRAAADRLARSPLLERVI